MCGVSLLCLFFFGSRKKKKLEHENFEVHLSLSDRWSERASKAAANGDGANHEQSVRWVRYVWAARLVFCVTLVLSMVCAPSVDYSVMLSRILLLCSGCDVMVTSMRDLWRLVEVTKAMKEGKVASLDVYTHVELLVKSFCAMSSIWFWDLYIWKCVDAIA